MTPARIAELLDPYLGPPDARRLAPDAFDCISTYINLLQRWNARINLTAIRGEEEIVTRHFGESLFTARHLFPLCSPACPEPGRRVPPVVQVSDGFPAAAITNDERPTTNDGLKLGDVGSGAGFPGIPIKLWAPEISLTLIESNHKKAAFLHELVRSLTLTDVNIQNTRVESLTPSSFDVVTLRAVERFESILPIAASLLRPHGRLALLIGESQLPQAQSILPTLTWSDPLPFPHSESRVLALGHV